MKKNMYYFYNNLFFYLMHNYYDYDFVHDLNDFENLIYEFFNIEPKIKKKIAEELGDKPVNEIKNKISEIRNLFL